MKFENQPQPTQEEIKDVEKEIKQLYDKIMEYSEVLDEMDV